MKTAKDIVNRDLGVTALTREKHGYNGFAVRKSRYRHLTWRYVSAAPGQSPGKTPAASREKALSYSRELYASVCEILNNSRSWRTSEERPVLTKTAAARVKDLGFSIKFPA